MDSAWTYCDKSTKSSSQIKLSIAVEGETPLKLINKERLIRELSLAKDTLPTPELLSTLNLNCKDNIFFEILLGSIRGSLISFQSWLWKVSNSKKASLNSQINSLRDDFLINSARISDLQAELNALTDLEVREKIKTVGIMVKILLPLKSVQRTLYLFTKNSIKYFLTRNKTSPISSKIF